MLYREIEGGYPPVWFSEPSKYNFVAISGAQANSFYIYVPNITDFYAVKYGLGVVLAGNQNTGFGRYEFL